MNSFGFKQITKSNWLSPDDVSRVFSKLSPTGKVISMDGPAWLEEILKSQLTSDVPLDIRKLYEVARGALIYGWFFYPLYTLGLEQLLRVSETAISIKCEIMKAPKKIRMLEEKINWLADNQILKNNDVRAWHSMRELRNISSHPVSQSIHTPGNALGFLEIVANKINALFS